MKRKIVVRHYNRKGEKIDITSRESRAKIEAAIAGIISREMKI